MKKLHKLKALVLAAIFGVIPLMSSLPVKADTLGTSSFYSVGDSVSRLAESQDGNIWLPSLSLNKVYKMSRTGNVTTYSSPKNYNDITAGPDNNMWLQYAFNISKMAPDGTVTEFHYPASYAAENSDIVYGPDGDLWFGLKSDNYVEKLGHMQPDGTYLSPYDLNGNQPIAIVSDVGHSTIWVAEYNFNSSHSYTGSVIEKITMDGTRTGFQVSSGIGSINDIAIGPDGNLWFDSKSSVGFIDQGGNFTTYNFGYTSSNGFRQMTSGRDGNLWITRANATISRVTTGGVLTNYSVFPSGAQSPLIRSVMTGKDGNLWLTGVSDGVNKVIKFGTGYTDNDEDGLTLDQENAQGTLDSNWDTDGDGLSDYTESTSYGARNNVFCDASVTTCEYPDPTTKDIYVENDWMVDPGSSGFSGQLNSTQINYLKSAFLNKNIKLHIDTGQLGGGNEVPYNSSIHFKPSGDLTNFYDYKEGGNGISSQFSPSRHDIYHYLITGNTYAEHPDSSGTSFAGDDDLFVAYGLIKAHPEKYSSFDTAVSGTVMHELGHNLCLTTDQYGVDYSGQPASCRFSGIDAQDGGNYPSVMNYDAQFFQTNYSDGLELTNDHDDWGAIRVSDFIYSGRGDLAHGASVTNPTLKKHFTKRNDRNKSPTFEPSIHIMPNRR